MPIGHGAVLFYLDKLVETLAPGAINHDVTGLLIRQYAIRLYE